MFKVKKRSISLCSVTDVGEKQNFKKRSCHLGYLICSKTKNVFESKNSQKLIKEDNVYSQNKKIGLILRNPTKTTAANQTGADQV